MTDLTPERLVELRRIASAATPGPWRMHDLDDNEVTSYITSAALPPIMPDLATVRFADDAHYIAAFSPPTVLALLDRIEELEHKVVEHKVVSQRLALHRLQDAHNRLLWKVRARGREWEVLAEAVMAMKYFFDSDYSDPEESATLNWSYAHQKWLEALALLDGEKGGDADE